MSEESLVRIASPEEQAIVQYSGVGFESRMFKLMPLWLKLIQPTTRGLSKLQGNFKATNSEDIYEEMHIVLLTAPKETRCMFVPGAELGAYPLCKSRDGIVPVMDDDRLQPQAMRCDKCEQSSWKKWQKTHAQEDLPPCGNSETLFFVDRKAQWPFLLQLSGKSLSTKKLPPGVQTLPLAMQTVARLRMRIKQEKGIDLNIFDFSMRIKPVQIQNKQGGDTYIVSFYDIAPIAEGARAEFGELYRQYVSQRETIDADMEAGIEAEEVQADAAGEDDQTKGVSYEV